MGGSKQDIQRLLRDGELGRLEELVPPNGLALAILDPDGAPLYEWAPLPELCSRICLRCLPGAVPECFCSRGNVRRNDCCAYGLSCFVIPVTAGGGLVAYLTGGHSYKDVHIRRNSLQNAPVLAKRLGAAEEFIAGALSAVPVVDRETFEGRMKLGEHIASGLSQKLGGARRSGQPCAEGIWKRAGIEAWGERDDTIQVKQDFLFNMLNCIARAAYFEQAAQTEALVYQLSDLLRFYTKSSASTHTIGMELEHVEKYLYMQKARFQSRLSYSIDVPDHIRSCHILNAVLQPLVDNALVHGIMRRRDGGEIRLRGRSCQDRLTFLIIDNGSGFSREALRRFRTGALPGRKISSLEMINQRLKRCYGDPYGLEIVKSDANGSTVSVTVPKNAGKG